MLVLKKYFLSVLVILALTSTHARAGSEDELKTYVDENTQELVNKLNNQKSLYKEDPEAFYDAMNKTLDQFVDFRRIAARVMGRYARQSTPEQRDDFVERFKRSLFDAYAQALVDSEGFEIKVQDAEILPGNKNRASVQMQLTSSDGNRYSITYSMYKNKNDRWLMENVIVEGVNIGLAFRDRFAQEMEQNRGEIQAVIDGWGSAVQSLKLEEEMDQS